MITKCVAAAALPDLQWTLQWLNLLGRGSTSNEIELLVLRHQLAVARRAEEVRTLASERGSRRRPVPPHGERGLGSEVRGALAAEPAFDCGTGACAGTEQQLSCKCENILRRPYPW
jgi:hypothetical protein